MVDAEKTPITCMDCGAQDLIDVLETYEWMENHPCTSSTTMRKKAKGVLTREGLRFPS